MPRSGRYSQRCPHHPKAGWISDRPHIAVCIQVTTVGETPRRRARAMTIYPCDECIDTLLKKSGRAVRVALAKAVMQQSAQLDHQKAVAHARK